MKTISLEEALARASGPFFICTDTVERPKADAPVLIHCFSNFAEAVALLKRARYSDSREGAMQAAIFNALLRFEQVEIP